MNQPNQCVVPYRNFNGTRSSLAEQHQTQQSFARIGLLWCSFAIADLSCNTPGCAFDKHDGTGGRAPGECTSTSDILSDYEISRIIKDFSIKANYDKKGGRWTGWLGMGINGILHSYITLSEYHTLISSRATLYDLVQGREVLATAKAVNVSELVNSLLRLPL